MAVVSVTADRLCHYVCYLCRNCVYGCGLSDCQWTLCAMCAGTVCTAVVSVTADRLCHYVCYVCRNCVYGCGLNDCQQLGLTAAGDKGANKSLLPTKVSKRYGSQNLCLHPSNKTTLMY